MTTKEFNERKRFLDVYSEFDKWLKSIGFRAGHYWTESATPLDCSYSHYKDHIDSLYGVEHNIHDVLKLSIRFLRDRHEHKFMFVGEMGSHSEVHSLEQTKEIILNKVRELRDSRLAELNELINL